MTKQLESILESLPEPSRTSLIAEIERLDDVWRKIEDERYRLCEEHSKCPYELTRLREENAKLKYVLDSRDKNFLNEKGLEQLREEIQEWKSVVAKVSKERNEMEKENERLHDEIDAQLKELIDRQQVFQARETAWRAFRGAVEGMPKGWGIDFSSDSRAAYALWMEERDAALLLAPKEE